MHISCTHVQHLTCTRNTFIAGMHIEGRSIRVSNSANADHLDLMFVVGVHDQGPAVPKSKHQEINHIVPRQPVDPHPHIA